MKLLLLIGALLGCQLERGAGAVPDRTILKIDLQNYTRSGVGVEFATDARSVCVWWWPDPPIGDFRKLPVEFVVFDLHGGVLNVSSNTLSRAEALRAFPSLVWRETQQEFVKSAVGWAFAHDFSQGLRIRRTRDSEHTAEMWALPARGEPIWSVHLPRCTQPEPVKILLAPTDKTILINLTGSQGIVLDRDTGKTQYTFPFGPIESDAEALQRKKKFGFRSADDGHSLQFIAYALSQDTSNGRLACGAFFDKRIRVVEVAPSGNLVFEANTDVNPSRPIGGNWKVQRVQFLADGNYLLAQYEFGGRGTTTVLNPVEILETRTWKRVWKESDLGIRGVTLSPDGTTLAFLRDDGLEIHPFAGAATSAHSPTLRK